MTTFKKLVAGAIFLELGIFVAASLIKNSILMLNDLSFVPYNSNNNDLLYTLKEPIKDMLDMLIFLGLLYLFYWQSMQRQTKEGNLSSAEVYDELTTESNRESDDVVLILEEPRKEEVLESVQITSAQESMFVRFLEMAAGMRRGSKNVEASSLESSLPSSFGAF